MTGEYQFCFSNEFSTFTHKTVYFDFQVGDEKPLHGDGRLEMPMTQVTGVGSQITSSFLQIYKLATDRDATEYINFSD